MVTHLINQVLQLQKNISKIEVHSLFYLLQSVKPNYEIISVYQMQQLLKFIHELDNIQKQNNYFMYESKNYEKVISLKIKDKQLNIEKTLKVFQVDYISQKFITKINEFFQICNKQVGNESVLRIFDIYYLNLLPQNPLYFIIEHEYYEKITLNNYYQYNDKIQNFLNQIQFLIKHIMFLLKIDEQPFENFKYVQIKQLQNNEVQLKFYILEFYFSYLEKQNILTGLMDNEPLQIIKPAIKELFLQANQQLIKESTIIDIQKNDEKLTLDDLNCQCPNIRNDNFILYIKQNYPDLFNKHDIRVFEELCNDTTLKNISLEIFESDYFILKAELNNESVYIKAEQFIEKSEIMQKQNDYEIFYQSQDIFVPLKGFKIISANNVQYLIVFEKILDSNKYFELDSTIQKLQSQNSKIKQIFFSQIQKMIDLKILEKNFNMNSIYVSNFQKNTPQIFFSNPLFMMKKRFSGANFFNHVNSQNKIENKINQFHYQALTIEMDSKKKSIKLLQTKLQNLNQYIVQIQSNQSYNYNNSSQQISNYFQKLDQFQYLKQNDEFKRLNITNKFLLSCLINDSNIIYNDIKFQPCDPLLKVDKIRIHLSVSKFLEINDIYDRLSLNYNLDYLSINISFDFQNDFIDYKKLKEQWLKHSTLQDKNKKIYQLSKSTNLSCISIEIQKYLSFIKEQVIYQDIQHFHKHVEFYDNIKLLFSLKKDYKKIKFVLNEQMFFLNQQILKILLKYIQKTKQIKDSQNNSLFKHSNIEQQHKINNDQPILFEFSTTQNTIVQSQLFNNIENKNESQNKINKKLKQKDNSQNLVFNTVNSQTKNMNDLVVQPNNNLFSAPINNLFASSQNSLFQMPKNNIFLQNKSENQLNSVLNKCFPVKTLSEMKIFNLFGEKENEQQNEYVKKILINDENTTQNTQQKMIKDNQENKNNENSLQQVNNEFISNNKKVEIYYDSVGQYKFINQKNSFIPFLEKETLILVHKILYHHPKLQFKVEQTELNNIVISFQHKKKIHFGTLDVTFTLIENILEIISITCKSNDKLQCELFGKDGITLNYTLIERWQRAELQTEFAKYLIGPKYISSCCHSDYNQASTIIQSEQQNLKYLRIGVMMCEYSIHNKQFKLIFDNQQIYQRKKDEQIEIELVFKSAFKFTKDAIKALLIELSKVPALFKLKIKVFHTLEGQDKVQVTSLFQYLKKLKRLVSLQIS